MSTYKSYLGKILRAEARCAVGIGIGSVGQSGLVAVASRKVVRWDLRLARLLAHLFTFPVAFLCGIVIHYGPCFSIHSSIRH